MDFHRGAMPRLYHFFRCIDHSSRYIYDIMYTVGKQVVEAKIVVVSQICSYLFLKSERSWKTRGIVQESPAAPVSYLMEKLITRKHVNRRKISSWCLLKSSIDVLVYIPNCRPLMQITDIMMNCIQWNRVVTLFLSVLSYLSLIYYTRNYRWIWNTSFNSWPRTWLSFCPYSSFFQKQSLEISDEHTRYEMREKRKNVICYGRMNIIG